MTTYNFAKFGNNLDKELESGFKAFWRRAFDFRGKTSRAEFWWRVLGNALIMLALIIYLLVSLLCFEGVINTFVVFLSRVIGNIVDRVILRNEEDGPGAGYFITSLVLDIVLGLLGSMLVMAYSRHREFQADAGAAKALGSTVPMINALARLGGQPANELPGNVKGFGINGGIGSLFASHPSIEERIKALRELQVK